MKSDQYNGSIQRGTRVKWNKDRKTGTGFVAKVHGVKYEDVLNGTKQYDDTEWDVKDDDSGEIIRCNHRQIRFAGTPNRKKKQTYAAKNGL